MNKSNNSTRERVGLVLHTANLELVFNIVISKHVLLSKWPLTDKSGGWLRELLGSRNVMYFIGLEFVTLPQCWRGGWKNVVYLCSIKECKMNWWTKMFAHATDFFNKWEIITLCCILTAILPLTWIAVFIIWVTPLSWI